MTTQELPWTPPRRAASLGAKGWFARSNEGAWLWNGVFVVVLVAWLATGPRHYGSYMLWCALTSIVSFFVFVNPFRRDWFEPIRTAVALHGVSFGLGPLLLAPSGYYGMSYLEGDEVAYLSEAAPLTFVALLFILAGYALPRLLQVAPSNTLAPRVRAPSAIVTFGLLLLLAGLSAWLVLVASRGGLTTYLSFGGSRSDIFRGVFGGFYWATFFSVAGLCALGAAWAHRRPAWVWVVAMLVALSYVPFQGRDEVLAPLYCALVLIHYRRRPVRAWVVLPAMVALALVAGFLNFYRNLPEVDKRSFIANPTANVAAFGERLGDEGLALIANNLEQTDSLLLALKHARDEGPLYGATLFDWLEPVDHLLLSDVLNTQNAGRVIVVLADPDARFVNTAASPSLLGEFALNFGVAGVLLGALLWGVALRGLQSLLLASSRQPWLLMLYPYLSWVLIKSCIDGTVLFFRIFVVGVPLLLLYLSFARARAPRLTRPIAAL